MDYSYSIKKPLKQSIKEWNFTTPQETFKIYQTDERESPQEA